MHNQSHEFNQYPDAFQEDTNENYAISTQEQYQTIPSLTSSNEKHNNNTFENNHFLRLKYQTGISMLILIIIGFFYFLTHKANDTNTNTNYPKAISVPFLFISILLALNCLILLKSDPSSSFPWTNTNDLHRIIQDYYKEYITTANILMSIVLLSQGIIVKYQFLLLLSLSLCFISLYYYGQCYSAIYSKNRLTMNYNEVWSLIVFYLPISLLLGWDLIFVIETLHSKVNIFLDSKFIEVCIMMTMTCIVFVNMTYHKDIFFSAFILMYQCNLIMRRKDSGSFKLNCLFAFFTILSIIWSTIANIKEKYEKQMSLDESNDVIKKEYYDQEN